LNCWLETKTHENIPYYHPAILHLSCMVLAGKVDPFHETPREYAARAQWLRDAKIGVVRAWNPSSITLRKYPGAARIMARTSTTSFTNSSRGKVQRRRLVKLFYDSGIRYAVIVSKHHDGFSMFDTKVPVCSEYSVMKAPFGRDYVKEISDACHRDGVKFCFITRF